MANEIRVSEIIEQELQEAIAQVARPYWENQTLLRRKIDAIMRPVIIATQLEGERNGLTRADKESANYGLELHNKGDNAGWNTCDELGHRLRALSSSLSVSSLAFVAEEPKSICLRYDDHIHTREAGCWLYRPISERRREVAEAPERLKTIAVLEARKAELVLMRDKKLFWDWTQFDLWLMKRVADIDITLGTIKPVGGTNG